MLLKGSQASRHIGACSRHWQKVDVTPLCISNLPREALPPLCPGRRSDMWLKPTLPHEPYDRGASSHVAQKLPLNPITAATCTCSVWMERPKQVTLPVVCAWPLQLPAPSPSAAARTDAALPCSVQPNTVHPGYKPGRYPTRNRPGWCRTEEVGDR